MTAAQYIEELISERDRLDPILSSNSIRLLEAEIEKVERESHGAGVELPQTATEAEPYDEEVVKLVEKVMLPIDQYPKFNFVGKIIGPKGSTLKNIVALTQTKISVLGRGSTRDGAVEQELFESGELKHQHFGEPLHILISVEAPRSEAHERISHAMEEINKVMSGDNSVGVGEVNGGQEVVTVPAMNYGAPIIKVGIPPPGAIVLNEASLRGLERDTKRFRDKAR